MANNTPEPLWNTDINSTECVVLQEKEFIPWNNSHNIVSVDVQDTFRKLKNLVIVPIACLVGVPANIINMAVFYKQGLKERINVCLFTLSLADGLYLVVNIVPTGEQFYLSFTTGHLFGPIAQWMINHLLLGLYGFSWVSQILSAIVASERCFCILQPLKSQTILSTSTMTAIIVTVFVVVTGLRFIAVTRFYAICGYDTASDSIITIITGREFYYRHQKLVDFFDIVVYGFGIPWVVIVVVITTTVVTAIRLRQAAEWRACMSSNSGIVSTRDIAVTRMLIGNSVFFIVCVFPFGLNKLILLFIPEMNAGRRYHNVFFLGQWLLNMLSNINSTFNFVIYFAMGTRYRRTFWALLRRKSTTDIPSKH